MSMSTHLLICIHVELPPTKRRRTLAGSIVSTALSAALIGTAVGLTVYRLLVYCFFSTLSNLTVGVAGETAEKNRNRFHLLRTSKVVGFLFRHRYVLLAANIVLQGD
jgi:hypothetical protein